MHGIFSRMYSAHNDATQSWIFGCHIFYSYRILDQSIWPVRNLWRSTGKMATHGSIFCRTDTRVNCYSLHGGPNKTYLLIWMITDHQPIILWHPQKDSLAYPCEFLLWKNINWEYETQLSFLILCNRNVYAVKSWSYQTTEKYWICGPKFYSASQKVLSDSTELKESWKVNFEV